ncbi:RNA polymerase sigma-70 factor [Euzebyella marina]|uniref:RNA polymerase sigma-70 factor n=1 Tax=Euzebyella marina TaxID=1761453 RepID=A0A3G2L374_9FLAO|nr:RNA polymerase sigma-70 factor [Euzebyella marina]AYN66693.1 RNA polymerase sigma-70 factor [Euzebyella marina]
MNSQISDRQLIDGIKRGDNVSFQMVYNKYFDRLYRYSQAMITDGQLSEDIIQELFTTLWMKRSHLNIVNLEAYLVTALRHKIINVYRNNRYVDLDETIIEALPGVNEIEEKQKETDLESEFKNLLSRLPRKCRNVFYLSRIKNYRNKEIAEELDISIRTVETHISNALQYFKVY